jgi:transcriptional regulator with PAS, ATPase and Fis domain
LFESEFFGYEKGAFRGAMTRKPGLVETAQGGTLFLDEIGDVPLSMQVKLLRLIETGTFRRVGSTETLHTDFRLVAATHKPLLDMTRDGRFRQDLYYRISLSGCLHCASGVVTSRFSSIRFSSESTR